MSEEVMIWWIVGGSRVRTRGGGRNRLGAEAVRRRVRERCLGVIFIASGKAKQVATDNVLYFDSFTSTVQAVVVLKKIRKHMVPLISITLWSDIERNGRKCSPAPRYDPDNTADLCTWHLGYGRDLAGLQT